MSFANNPYPYPYPAQAYPGYQPHPMPDQLSALRSQQYQPAQQSMMGAPPQMAPQADNGMIWVQGEAGARGFIVAAGNTVPLWDSEGSTIYLKSVDPTGVPSMRIFDYTERTAAQRPPVQNPQQEYITRGEFEAVIARLMGGNAPTVPVNTPTAGADTPISKEGNYAD